MASGWYRVWNEMVNDPKWRTISKVAGQEISRVQAVYLQLLTSANENEKANVEAGQRGRTRISTEDIASSLDLKIEDVEAILEAMQIRVLDGELIKGWPKRQPKRAPKEAARQGEESSPATGRAVTASKPRRARKTPQQPAPGPQEDSVPKTDVALSVADPLEPEPPEPKGAEAVEDDGFEAFWQAYPVRRRQAKPKARAAWEKIMKAKDKPPLADILAALAAQAQGPDWLKDGGQFIPLPASWLNAERWLDEVTTEPLNGRSELTARNIAAMQNWKPPTPAGGTRYETY